MPMNNITLFQNQVERLRRSVEIIEKGNRNQNPLITAGTNAAKSAIWALYALYQDEKALRKETAILVGNAWISSLSNLKEDLQESRLLTAEIEDCINHLIETRKERLARMIQAGGPF